MARNGWNEQNRNSVRGAEQRWEKSLAEKYSDGEQLWLDIGIIDYDRAECV